MAKWLAGVLLVMAACGGGSSSGWVVQEDVPGAGVGNTYVVWAFAEDDVWLGGQSVWNWDGAGWTEVPLPVTGAYIVDFWGLAPDDLWAVADAAVFRWDGAAWSELPAAEQLPFEALSVIWASGPSDVWIGNDDNSKVYHFDGTAWTRETLQFVAASALWGSAPDDVWLTGVSDTYHYDGASWSRYEPPITGGDPGGSFALWGDAPDDVWASSIFGFVHWDGATWTEVEADDEYNSMWGFGPDDIIAVGNRGTVARWDGSAWTESDGHLELQQNFTHVHGSSPDNIWATAVDFDTLSGFVLRLEE